MVTSSLVQYSMCIMTIKCMSESVVLTCLMSNILTNTDTSCMKLLQYMDIALIGYILTNSDTSCMRLILNMSIHAYYILDMHQAISSTKLETCYNHDCRLNWMQLKHTQHEL
ncbi:hypothetical protein QVD99_001068 [Batrachochytrium dendrobatidis]|nr:hypothetical protein QVD99_001068 [Batrachochytrium dendrobatidis]